MGSREANDAGAANYGPIPTSGVHQHPTQPAPYLDEPLDFGESSLASETLSACFRPVVALRTGKTFGFEALPYSGQQDGAQVVEELFARAAFEKKVGELGRVVRASAFAQCSGYPVFVSVHPHELKEAWLIRPDDPLCSHDAEVFLQLSQSTYSPMCLHVLSEVASRSGIALVLDDFGGNTSNLRQAVELSPVFVKLAIELVQSIDASPRKRVVVSAVVQMCMDLGAQVIAQGIETEREARVLSECGVAYGEGPMLGLPTVIPNLSRWKGAR